METIIHEYYVSLEVSKLLKEAGFDWAGYDFYNLDDNNKFHFVGVGPTNWNDIDGRLSAPTLEVAQRWLREVKHVEVLIEVKYLPHTVYYVRVEYEKYGYVLGTHSTYEEAQEAGIKKALEIILEKGE